MREQICEHRNGDASGMLSETRIEDTVQKSIRTFYRSEKRREPSYLYFLYVQLCYTKKRWWILQAALLAGFLVFTGRILSDESAQKALGVLASLFVILIIPSFFREESQQMSELESTLFFSLREVYAARMVLFGLFDSIILAVFCVVLRQRLHLDLYQMVSRFFIPLVISSVICFLVLGSRWIRNPYLAGSLCVLFCSVWWFITANDRIYASIARPVWILILAAGILFLVICICSLLKRADRLHV